MTYTYASISLIAFIFTSLGFLLGWMSGQIWRIELDTGPEDESCLECGAEDKSKMDSMCIHKDSCTRCHGQIMWEDE